MQGLSFPWVVRRLGVRDTEDIRECERNVRLALARAGLAELYRQAGLGGPLNTRAARAVRDHYEERLAEADDAVADTLGWSPQMEHSITWRRLRHASILAERAELGRLHERDEIPSELVPHIGRELDLEEARLGR